MTTRALKDVLKAVLDVTEYISNPSDVSICKYFQSKSVPVASKMNNDQIVSFVCRFKEFRNFAKDYQKKETKRAILCT